jgi:plastocyanin
MRRFLLLAALLLPALSSAEAPAQVTIRSFAFGPQAITVRAGTTVTWINRDVEPHTVITDSDKFRSEALDTGDSFSVTFDTAGTYGYFCSLHPHMTGAVTVTPR